jgi:hypothetical protein
VAACAGMNALCQRTGCYSRCWDMYLELRHRPMGREHARPQRSGSAPGRQPPVWRREEGGLWRGRGGGSQTWRFLFDHLLIAAALGPELVPLICGLHVSIRWGDLPLKQRG